MYKAVKKTKFIPRDMKSLGIHTGASTVHQEDTKSFIYVVEDKKFTPRVNTLTVMSDFYKKILTNGLVIPKYDNPNVMPAYMCTKTCSGPIISRSTKWMTRFRFYPTRDAEHHELMRLH